MMLEGQLETLGPMALAAAKALTEAPDGTIIVEERAVVGLKAELARYFGRETLVHAVVELLLFARHLREDERASRAADTLRDVAKTATNALRELCGGGAALEALLIERPPESAQLLGLSARPPAPKTGPAEGQVSAGPLARYKLGEGL